MVSRASQIALPGVAWRLGLIGHPVAHSLSPRMQQAALDARHLRAHYALWDTLPEELAARIARLREPGVLGANVTIPYKAAVVPLLDAIAPEARHTAGVVNTIVCEPTETGMRLVGHNTDVAAVLRLLDEHVSWQTRRVVVLGAGGAAQAALGAAHARGAEVFVAARQRAAAQAALEALWLREHDATSPATNDVPSEDRHARALALADTARLATILTEADVLIQATPVGMLSVAGIGRMEPVTPAREPVAGTEESRHREQHAPLASLDSPIPLDLLDRLPAHAFVLDMIYAPRETALVRAARRRGLRASGGLPMLLHQGAAAFELWTDQPAPLDVMRDAIGL